MSRWPIDMEEGSPTQAGVTLSDHGSFGVLQSLEKIAVHVKTATPRSPGLLRRTR